MKRMRGFGVGIFLVAGVSLGFACGGDDDDTMPMMSTASSSGTGSTTTSSGTTGTSTTSSTGGQTSTSSSSGAPDAQPPQPQLPAPTITTSPPAGSDGKYTTVPVQITITHSTPNAVIFYTTDGTNPGVGSNRYTGPFDVSAEPTTIVAIATFPRFANSEVAVQVIDFNLCPCGIDHPTFSPTGGEQANTFGIVITTPVSEGATICYTTDGTTEPMCTNGACNPGSTQYVPTAPVPVNASNTTVRALACKAGSSNTAVVAQTYTLRVAPIISNPAGPGNLNAPTDVMLSTATQNVIIHYTTDGTLVSCTSGTAAASPVSITAPASTTINAIGCRPNFLDSVEFTQTYGVLPPAPLFVTGPDAAQLAGDPSQFNATTGTVFSQDVRLVIPNEQNASGAAIDTRPGTRRAGDVDCFTTDGTTPACSVGVSNCSAGTRYVVPNPSATSATTSVTSTGGQPIVSRDGQVVKVIRCREGAGVSEVASYTYGLKVGPIVASYVTRNSSFTVVPFPASSANNDAAASVSTGAGVRIEFTGGDLGNPTDNGLDSVSTGVGSMQPGAVGSQNSTAPPKPEDEEKLCYTLDGVTAPTCNQVVPTNPGQNVTTVACGTGSTDHSVIPIGSGNFTAANATQGTAVDAPAGVGTPQRALPLTLRAIACKPKYQNSNERQITFAQ